MGVIKNFEDLEIWQKATGVAVKIYNITSTGALKNDFGMKDQIQRAAVSISSNIAEGFEYSNNRDFIRFLRYSKASCGELRSQLYIISQLNIINKALYNELYEELLALSKRIAAFIKYLKKFEKDKVES